METLRELKDLIEKLSADSYKVYEKGNHSASIRARKHAQRIKELIVIFRKEILEEVKKHNVGKDNSHKKSKYNSYNNLKKKK